MRVVTKSDFDCRKKENGANNIYNSHAYFLFEGRVYGFCPILHCICGKEGVSFYDAQNLYRFWNQAVWEENKIWGVGLLSIWVTSAFLFALKGRLFKWK